MSVYSFSGPGYCMNKLDGLPCRAYNPANEDVGSGWTRSLFQSRAGRFGLYEGGVKSIAAARHRSSKTAGLDAALVEAIEMKSAYLRAPLSSLYSSTEREPPRGRKYILPQERLCVQIFVPSIICQVNRRGVDWIVLMHYRRNYPMRHT